MARTERVSSPHHPLLADFAALNDPQHRREVERAGDYFVVEGHLALERLLATPGWEVRSIALLERAATRLEAQLAEVDAPVAIASEEALRAVVGFDLHRGVLASVARQPIETVADAGLPAEGVVLVAQGVNDHENLGALYRNAAAFGAAAVVLDERCADPFYRRAVRVSLGHVLAVATVRCAADAAGVRELQGAGASVLALSPSGEIALREVMPAGRDAGPTALVVGAEGPGLTPEALAAADQRVRIEMADGVDSLNVSAAAAVALHHLLAAPGGPRQ